MRSNSSRSIALSGVLAALAIVIMCLGGIIPIATYVCPMLCTITQQLVFRFCGKKIGWTWYAVVSMLALLLSPDKEAAMVFLVIGYYPLIKVTLERSKLQVLWKLLYFNVSIVIVYWIMIHFFGMQDVAAENMAFGVVGLLIILILGNITFFLLDKLLVMTVRKLQ